MTVRGESSHPTGENKTRGCRKGGLPPSSVSNVWYTGVSSNGCRRQRHVIQERDCGRGVGLFRPSRELRYVERPLAQRVDGEHFDEDAGHVHDNAGFDLRVEMLC